MNAFGAAFVKERGDRGKIETTIESDGRTKVVVRGESHDGRRFLEAFFEALTANDPASSAFDVDLDVKVSTLTGFHGEALRDVTLLLSRRGGELVAFSLAGKFGAADLHAEMQTRPDGSRAIHLETDNAGALFRFINVYRRIRKGSALIAIDLPVANVPARQNIVDIRDFSIVGEPDYRPLAAGLPKSIRGDDDVLKVTHLRLGFKLSADQVAIRDGIVAGPLFGATVEGKVSRAQDDVALRGIIVPLFINNGILPFTPLDLPAESLFGMSYQITGSTKTSAMRIDSFEPVVPGILRKLFTWAPDEK